jgi:hypothetical protein
MSERYLTDAQGNRVGVVLDLETYRQLLEAQEELEDIRAADAAKLDDPTGLPLDEALAAIERERAALQKAS